MAGHFKRTFEILRYSVVVRVIIDFQQKQNCQSVMTFYKTFYNTLEKWSRFCGLSLALMQPVERYFSLPFFFHLEDFFHSEKTHRRFFSFRKTYCSKTERTFLGRCTIRVETDGQGIPAAENDQPRNGKDQDRNKHESPHKTQQL